MPNVGMRGVQLHADRRARMKEGRLSLDRRPSFMMCRIGTTHLSSTSSRRWYTAMTLPTNDSTDSSVSST